MTNAELQAKLKSVPLFREFTEQELTQFFDLLDPVPASAGAVVVHQDERGDAMYVVAQGQCRVVHHKAGHDIELAMLKDGDFFGEIALVDEGPRSADVIAVSDVVLLKITQAAIGAVAGVYPSAAFKFLVAIGRIMVERLRRANQRYVDSMLFPVQGKE